MYKTDSNVNSKNYKKILQNKCIKYDVAGIGYRTN